MTERRSPNKMQELILYIASSVEDLTFAKLCCLLYISDFTMYKNFGRSITGFNYYKKVELIYPYGLKAILARMIDSQVLTFKPQSPTGETDA